MAAQDGLSEGEYLVLRLHPHWKTILRPLLVLALIIAAALVLLIMLPSSVAKTPVRLGIGAVAVVAAIAWCAVPLLRWRTTTYELTNRRLRLRAGILTRTGRDFPLSRISDITFTHGLLDRILGSGKLVVESAGEHGQLVLTEIPHVQQVQSQLFQLVEDEELRPEH
jgi:uncharacterized membrane protein YdbT with pleckstrin-like domain